MGEGAVDWGFMMNVFFSGVIGVFLVMLLLQVSTQASSAAARFIESRSKADEK